MLNPVWSIVFDGTCWYRITWYMLWTPVNTACQHAYLNTKDHKHQWHVAAIDKHNKECNQHNCGYGTDEKGPQPLALGVRGGVVLLSVPPLELLDTSTHLVVLPCRTLIRPRCCWRLVILPCKVAILPCKVANTARGPLPAYPVGGAWGVGGRLAARWFSAFAHTGVPKQCGYVCGIGVVVMGCFSSSLCLLGCKYKTMDVDRLVVYAWGSLHLDLDCIWIFVNGLDQCTCYLCVKHCW